MKPPGSGFREFTPSVSCNGHAAGVEKGGRLRQRGEWGAVGSHSLSIFIKLRSTGTGSPSRMTVMNSCTCMISYFSIRWLGGSAVQSTVCLNMFGGNHSTGGHWAKLMSSPSNWAVGARVRDTSSSQILLVATLSALAESWTSEDGENYPVPTPISATLRFSELVGMLGCRR